MLEEYQQLISDGIIVADAAQLRVARQLDALKTEIETTGNQRGKVRLLSRLLGSKGVSQRGMYIWGDVGRGKSMLMDLFFTNINFKSKRRVHFHAFMLEIHSKLYEWRNAHKDDADARDPIPDLADDIVRESQLLCFDELQVTDITDAMILGRLFTSILERGGIVIATSNRPPEDLYKDGLQRERFLPFIDLINERLDIVELNSHHDYRLKHLKSLSTVYFTPLGKEANRFLKTTFEEMTQGGKPRKQVLEVSGRKLTVEKAHNDVAWMSFSELCDKPLGAADYQELAREFSTLLLSDIPKMSKDQRNEAKRFVTLIDELYEHRVKLICTAAAPAQELYPEGDGNFEFQRTASRLIEMQSEKYLAKEHVV